MNYHSKHILVLSLPLITGVIWVSSFGLFTPDFYAQETTNWRAQSIGQDLIDLLLIAPVLIISTWLVIRDNKAGLDIWAGTNLYLIYTFAIYAFTIRFNNLFILYCINLGLAFYSMLLFLFWQTQQPAPPKKPLPGSAKWTGYYLALMAILFYALWLMDVIPAILRHTVPASLAEAGLRTNPVHVIDLSIFLPGMFLTGILLLRNHTLGWIMTPVILVFTILMNATIGGLMIVMDHYGLAANRILMGIMFALAIFSLLLLILFYRHPSKETKNPTV